MFRHLIILDISKYCDERESTFSGATGEFEPFKVLIFFHLFASQMGYIVDEHIEIFSTVLFI